MKKKWLSAVVAGVLALNVLAGCAQSGDGDAGTSEATDAASDDGKEGETGEDTPGNAGTGTASVDLSNGYTFFIADPIEPEELGSGEVKWSEERMSDGWMKVTNEGGATLGYATGGKISLIQVDGYAFKDMDGDGVLDGFEDWRLDDKVRAADLASQMTLEQIPNMLTHSTWSNFSNSIEGDDLAYLEAGGRAGVTRAAFAQGNQSMAVTWSNALQKAGEETSPWSIPVTVSADPNQLSSVIESLAAGATFDPDLIHEFGVEQSRMYRAIGVTMLLGPQIDLCAPTLARSAAVSGGTFSEDPALVRDLGQAYIDGLQSTYDASGNDLGWGEDSVTSVGKHFAGGGAAEGGREDHPRAGEFSVFPGNNFEAHTIPFFDGAFHLPGKTETVGGIMPNYSVAYSKDGSLGELVAGAYSSFKMGLLRDNGFDGYVVTDWRIVFDTGGCWGFEDYTETERVAWLLENGVDAMGGYPGIETMPEAYEILVDNVGEDEAEFIVRRAAYRFLVHEMQTKLFNNPYLTTEHALATTWSDEALAYGLSTQEKSVIMLKNTDNAIHEATSDEKLTVYIPYIFSPFQAGQRGNPDTPASWGPGIDLGLVEQYFNVVTDSEGEPSGTDADGNPVFTEADVVRASAADIASCDYAIVSMTAPSQSGTTDDDGNYLPASIQYEAYTATTARAESIAGDVITEVIPDGYVGQTTSMTVENRSYRGNSVGRDAHYADLETLQFVSGAVPDSCKVVVSITAMRSTCFGEVEPLADVILLNMVTEKTDVVLRIVAGQLEPSALLPIQEPLDMAAVEARYEDVPRSMECYVDADGNTYDFAFGMNWSGVINDSRVTRYKVDPITKAETIDFQFAN